MSSVAVLIPTFKPKSYLKACFNSLDRQTLDKEKFCVYIALNGSKEGYEEFIYSILDKMSFQYKYIYIQNSGVSNARNYLLDASFEEYIVFIDDDDVVTENYLENLLNVSTDTYMGITNIFEFTSNIEETKSHYIGNAYKKINSIEVSKLKTRKYYSSMVAKMLHRNMILDVRFDVKLKNSEDGLFMATISKNIHGVHKAPPDTCYYVQRRDESASQKKREYTQIIQVGLYLLNKYTELFFTKGYDKVFICTRLIATIRYAFYNIRKNLNI